MANPNPDDISFRRAPSSSEKSYQLYRRLQSHATRNPEEEKIDNPLRTVEHRDVTDLIAGFYLKLEEIKLTFPSVAEKYEGRLKNLLESNDYRFCLEYASYLPARPTMAYVFNENMEYFNNRTDLQSLSYKLMSLGEELNHKIRHIETSEQMRQLHILEEGRIKRNLEIQERNQEQEQEQEDQETIKKSKPNKTKISGSGLQFNKHKILI